MRASESIDADEPTDSRNPAPGPDFPRKSVGKPTPIEKSRLSGSVCRFEQVRGSGDLEVARLAGLQHGCVHRRQLLAAGIGRWAITHRLRTGRLHTLHTNVFLVGRATPERFTAAMAAALHFRGDAVLARQTAASLWGFGEDESALIEVTVVGRGAEPVRGVRMRQTARMHPRDVRWRSGIPVTSPARTLVDLAGAVDGFELEAAFARVIGLNLARPNQIADTLQRAGAIKGAKRLRALLEHPDRPADTRSAYERRLLQLIAAAELPRPFANAPVEGQTVDLFWPDRKLIVEFDGFEFHHDRATFESDRLRDQRLVAAGYRVIRITARQIDRTPYAVVARLTAALFVGL
jgi:very-short-patch-repair endonuclease